MTAPIIPLSVSLELLLDENSFTLGELPSHPLAAVYIPQFDAFQVTWFNTLSARIALLIAIGKATGGVSAADDALDDFIDVLDRTLLIVTKNDRKAPLYQLYFGLKAANLQKKPILGEELVTVKAWIPSLQGSPVPSLAALAKVLIAAIASADAAVAKLQATKQALKDFDTIGGKKDLIDTFNALRQSVSGDLAAIPHQNPAAMLPATFADRFYRHALNKGITALKDPKAVQTKIDAMSKKITAAQSHMADLKDAAVKQADAKALEMKDEAVLAQAKVEEAAAKQKRKDLEKQVKAAKNKIKKP
jgi:hypothetical protein